MYKKYLESLNEQNRIAIQLNGQSELGKLALSDERWAKDRPKNRSQRLVKKGEIYQFEFGKNFVPEMSYEHRGLIIGINRKILYVLPIFSYNPSSDSHKNAYHPTDNPDEKRDFYLLKNAEFSFIKHDSVLKMNELRSVSVNRILYQHDGRMDISGETYRKIEDLVLQKHFYQFHFELCKQRAELENAIAENKEKDRIIKALETRLKELQQE